MRGKIPVEYVSFPHTMDPMATITKGNTGNMEKRRKEKKERSPSWTGSRSSWSGEMPSSSTIMASIKIRSFYYPPN